LPLAHPHRPALPVAQNASASAGARDLRGGAAADRVGVGVTSELQADDRQYAAVLARRYFYDRSVTQELFVETFSGTTDPLIAELVDLVATEPAREGMLGVRHDQYVKHYWPAVKSVLEQLDRGAAGVLAAHGRFSPRKLLLFLLLGLFVAASAADHIAKIVQHVRGIERQPPWPLLGHTTGAVVMSLLFVVAVRNGIGSFLLYRAERKRRG
ncbi:MAG TPA: hypothetical protein VN181_02970, partial [Thermoanaerobaculia bacterium]|nr:hypothetical protein [Thermoanaerobaculia bacterium]